MLVASLYLPSGNPKPGPKLDYKLSWFNWQIDRSALLHNDMPAELAGDFNVVPTDFGINAMKSGARDALTELRPRGVRTVGRNGWIDAIRTLEMTRILHSEATCLEQTAQSLAKRCGLAA